MSMLSGKVALITGATSGIGEITARELAWLGATVLVNGRNPAKLDATLAMIREAVPGADVHGMQYDLSSLAQVHALAENVLTHFDRLDILVNNAGMMHMDERHSADGFELQFAVNHLSHFLLARLLLGRLEETAQQYGEARIINVSSDAHKGAHIDWDTFGRSGKGFGAYSQTKLANVYFTYELARRLAGTGVTANALHPGFVATGFAKTENPGYMKMAMALLKPLTKTPAKGAETTIYLASAPELTGVTGRYFANKKDIPSSKVSYDESEQRRLWAMSEEMAGLTTPEASAAAV